MKDIIKIEFMKLKHSGLMWIAILAPVLMVLQGAGNFIRYHKLFTEKGQNVWGKIYEQSSLFYAVMLLPILAAVIVTFLVKIENQNDGWKYFLTLPVSRAKVFISKFIAALTLILINILSFSCTVFIMGKLLGAEKEVPYGLIFGKPFAAAVTIIPVMIIIYIISIRFSGIGVPLGISIGLSVPAILVANTKFWAAYPWTYPIMAMLGGDRFDKGASVYMLSIVLSAVIFVYGCMWFKKRDVV